MKYGALLICLSVPARVAELVDALDLGSSGSHRGGSSPPSRTKSNEAFPKRGAMSIHHGTAS